jgi:hypothetical protein
MRERERERERQREREREREGDREEPAVKISGCVVIICDSAEEVHMTCEDVA